MPDIQEAKCFEFTVQILPPPLELFLYTPLSNEIEVSNVDAGWMDTNVEYWFMNWIQVGFHC